MAALWSLHDLTLHDARAVHALQSRAYDPSICEGISLFEHILRHDHAVTLAARLDDGTLIGYVLAYPAARGRDDFYDGPDACTDPQHFYLHELTCDPAYQGQGLGAQLYTALEDHVRSLGAQHIVANAIDGRLAFWQKMGFDAVSAADYHGMPSTRIVKIL